MTVNLGDKITSAEFNTLADLINSWFSDWGGSSITNKNYGDKIQAADFNEMIDRINVGVDIVDGVTGTLSNIITGNRVESIDYNTADSKEAAIRPLKNTIDPAKLSVHPGTTDVESTTWNGLVSDTIRHTLTDKDEAEHLFNSGGALNISLALAGGTNQRGVFGGGYGTNYTRTLDCITINSTGNAVSTSSYLTTWSYFKSATSNGANARGLFGGGIYTGNINTIEYININASYSSATDFGDLTAAKRLLAATSNGSNERGIFGGGYISAAINNIDYVTINSIGNATDFGDLTAAISHLSATSNGTNERGVFGGGYSGSAINTIGYITINSAGNATDFGDLTQGRMSLAATSNGTNQRGVFAGGADVIDNRYNIVDYITINSTGNATDFGDLTQARSFLGATSNGTDERGIFAGGGIIGSYVDTIDYITINSTGNATDFGNLYQARGGLGACSNGISSPKVWAELFSAMGTITMDLNDTSQSGSGGTPAALGYSDLTEVYQQIFTQGTNSNTKINARRSASGNYVEIQIVLTDSNVESFVNGTTTATFQFKKLDDQSYGEISLTVTAPVVTTIDPLYASGERGVFGGGEWRLSAAKLIEYLTICNLSNGFNFGDLTVGRGDLEGTSNGTNNRGIFAGGYISGSYGDDTIDYITINSIGNATDFGNLTVGKRDIVLTSNGTNERGVIGGGIRTVNLNVIEYITINSIGNATDFGDLTQARRRAGACSNATNQRGIFAGGYASAYANTIDYITINSTGNAIDFGDLIYASQAPAGTSNGTNERGVMGGGVGSSSWSVALDYITINSTGNALDFGDLTHTDSKNAASNGTNNRGVFAGYWNIEYITINSLGNATLFGDLLYARSGAGAISSA